MPLKSGFPQEKFQAMIAPELGVAHPFSDVWTRNAGIGVGDVELVPKLISLPLTMTDQSHATVAVTYEPKRTLRPGETLETRRTLRVIRTTIALREYRTMMIAQMRQANDTIATFR